MTEIDTLMTAAMTQLGRSFRQLFSNTRCHRDRVDDMTREELLDCLGPDWSRMTERERHLYGFPGGLSEGEMDWLWNERRWDDDKTAA